MTSLTTVSYAPRFHTLRTDGTAHCHGYAPDVEVGQQVIGAIYEVEPAAVVERTLFATCLPLGDQRWLVTLGRFDDWFLTSVQVVVEHEPHELDPIVETMLRGVTRIQCPTGHDYAGLQRWLARSGRQDLACEVGRLALAPLFGAMQGFHRSEQETLGLFRDDHVSFDGLAVMYGRAAAGDPECGRRLREIGGTNLLSCIALYLDARSMPRFSADVHTECVLASHVA